jgi:hypothetical protein
MWVWPSWVPPRVQQRWVEPSAGVWAALWAKTSAEGTQTHQTGPNSQELRCTCMHPQCTAQKNTSTAPQCNSRCTPSPWVPLLVLPSSAPLSAHPFQRTADRCRGNPRCTGK